MILKTFAVVDWFSQLPVRPSTRRTGSDPVLSLGAEHDQTSAPAPRWCHTHYGPFINNLAPISPASLHHRAANIPTNHILMTHDITSGLCVCAEVL